MGIFESKCGFDLPDISPPLARDRSPPSPFLIRTVHTDHSVTRADLSFAPNEPNRPKQSLCPPPPLRADLPKLAPNS